MEALGRLLNVVPIADGVAVSLKGASAVTFICTAADTFTITSASSFGGSYTDPGDIIDHYYQAAATNGTAVWAKETQAAGNAVVQAGAYTTAITVDAKSLPDGATHVKCTSTSTGLVAAIVHDLTVQRAPELLPALSA